MARTAKQPILQDHDWYAWERRAQEAGYGLVCGIDEAGRGPLAGPVCAAAVILPLDCQIPGLNDSKKLTEKKREALFPPDPGEGPGLWDWHGPAPAGNRRAKHPAGHLPGDEAGRWSSCPFTPGLGFGGRQPHAAPGDSRGDGGQRRRPVRQHRRRQQFWPKSAGTGSWRSGTSLYPQYGFAKHKGYGTKAHYEAIQAHGILPIHRRSFLKNLGEKS